MIVDSTIPEGAILEAVPPPSAAVSAVAVPRSLATPATPGTYRDARTLVSEGVSVWSDWRLEPENLETPPELVMLTPEVATLSGLNVTRLSDGVAVVRSRGIKRNYREIELDCRIRDDGFHSHFDGFEEGSLGELLTENLLTLIPEAPVIDCNLFSALDHANGIFVKNPACWAAGIDLTGVAVSTDVQGWGRANRGALITPRHVLGAKHWNVYYPGYAAGAGYNVGSRLRYVGSSGNIYLRTVTGVASGFGDLVVATLDADLPADVSPVPLVGDWIQRHTSGSSYYLAGTCFHVRQGQQARICMLGDPLADYSSGLGSATIGGTPFTNLMLSGGVIPEASLEAMAVGIYASRADAYLNASGGDSGSPVMILLPGGPALLWTWHYALSGTPVWGYNGMLVNALIEAADAAAGVSSGHNPTIAPDPFD